MDDKCIKNFAEELHKLLCKDSHEDLCTWYYEESWDEYTHRKYYLLAKDILNKMKKYSILVKDKSKIVDDKLSKNVILEILKKCNEV